MKRILLAQASLLAVALGPNAGGPVFVLGSPDLRSDCFVSDLAFSKKGEVVSVDCHAVVDRWDGKTGARVSGFATEGEIGSYEHVLSADGSIVAVVQAKDFMKGGPEFVVLWDAATGKKIGRLDDHPNRVNGLAISPDGSLVATADRDNAARIWDSSTGKIVFVLRGRAAWGGVLGIFPVEEPIWEENAVSFSDDGKLLGTAHAEGEVRVHDVATGDILHTMEGTKWGPAPVFLPGGKRVAYATYKGVNVFDLAEGKDVLALPLDGLDMMDRIRSLAVSPDGKVLAGGTIEAAICLWDLVKGGPPRVIVGHSDRVETLAFSHDSKLLASSGQDATIGLWDVAKGAEALPIVRHFGFVTDIALSPDGKLLVTAGADAWVHVWSLETGKLVRRLYSKQQFRRVWMDHAVEFSPDGTLLYSASTEGDVVAWNTGTGKEALRAGSPSVASDLAVSPDGKTLAIVDAWGSADIVEASTGKPLRRLDPEKGSWGYHFVRWLDQKTLVTAGMDSMLRIWSPASGKLLQEIEIEGSLYQLEIPPGAGSIAVRTYYELFTYVKKKGKWVKKKGAQAAASNVAFSPDAKSFAMGDEKSILVRDVASGKKTLVLGPGHSKVGDVAWSCDGSLIVAIQRDSTLSVWRVP